MSKSKLTAAQINSYQKSGIIYLPAFIFYDMDESTYRSFWADLYKNPKANLYTDGFKVYQVSWLRKLFEAFKGWLGFKNHCQNNKVTLTLAKIYDLWRETRWHENPTQSTEEMGIHNIIAEDATMTQTLSRLFFK